MKTPSGFLVMMGAVLALVAARGHAAENDTIPTVKIILYPTAEPRPALKYQLLPPLIERKPGNAAVYYNRITAEQAPLFGSGSIWQELQECLEVPLSELREDEEARKTIGILRLVLEDLDRAARSQYCDWQLPIREGEFYAMRIPEFQQTRAYARMLAPWVRLRIADGKYDEAVRGFQTGFSLARDVANAPCLVCGLVGCAIAGMMNEQVLDLIQQPDAPNLYWALSTLPRPMIDLRPCFDAEMYSLYFSFRDLYDLESKHHTPERWQQLLEETVEWLHRWTDTVRTPEKEQLLTVTWYLHAYPRAKRLLVERGHSPDEVEAMPAPQVILLAEMQNYDELRDDVFKWLSLPYPQASRGARNAEENLVKLWRSGQEIIPIAGALLPAVQSAKTAEVRIDREIALLRTLEALRLYGAANRGRLPGSLDDITQVPVPLDPVRGEPFYYRRYGNTAFLEVVDSPGPMRHWDGVRYEIEFARKGN
jgi:hypothetical protein